MRIQFNAGDVLPEVNLRVETGEQRWIRPFAEQRSNLTVPGNLTPWRPPYVVIPLRPLCVLQRQRNWGQLFQLIAHAKTVMACSQRIRLPAFNEAGTAVSGTREPPKRIGLGLLSAILRSPKTPALSSLTGRDHL